MDIVIQEIGIATAVSGDLNDTSVRDPMIGAITIIMWDQAMGVEEVGAMLLTSLMTDDVRSRRG